MAVDVRQMIDEAREVMTRRVYSDPYERNGVTVILASRVQGGGGGGGGTGQEPEAKGGATGSGWGGGFGLNDRPVGAFVIKGEEVRFVPALDLNRIIVGGQMVALAALLTIRVIAKARGRKRRG